MAPSRQCHGATGGNRIIAEINMPAQDAFDALAITNLGRHWVRRLFRQPKWGQLSRHPPTGRYLQGAASTWTLNAAVLRVLKPTNPTQALNKHGSARYRRGPRTAILARKESGKLELRVRMRRQKRPNYRVLVRKVGFICLTASLVCLPILRAQTGQPPLTKQAPLWSVKPKEVGYSLSVFRNFRPMVGGDRVKIQFLDNRRLALAWLTPVETQEKTIGPATDVLSHLHVSILDANTGQQVLNHEWPCSSVGVNLAHTASGQWLLSSDQTVTLYSRSFDKVRDLHNVGTQRSHTFISPSGRTFLSHVTDKSGAWSGQLRDAATFEVLDSWDDPLFAKAYIAYSDYFILAQITKPGTPQRMYIRKIGGDWNPYSASVLDSQPAGRSSYGFVNDDTVAGFPGHALVLETVGGTELFSLIASEAGLYLPSWSAAATSTRGERFAVILDRLRGLRNENLDMYPFQSEDRVIVYSIPQRGAVFSVKVKGISPWPALTSHLAFNAIALSPDGKLLAIVSDEGVRVYVLPTTE